MQLSHNAATAAVLLFLAVSIFSSNTDAHNITSMLEKHPEFSTYNRFLSETQLALDINHRQTITVCVVDNAGMSDLLSKNLTSGGMRNVLSLHVLLDYFDAKKLHQIPNANTSVATLFQATGSATESSGYVVIAILKGGKVGFSTKDSGGNISATFVKPIEAEPYNISVIQISNIFTSTEAEAPAPGPSQMNITDLMSANGCKVFAETLLANPAQNTFDDNVISGLTIFCPGDEAMKAFLPKYKNLTAADQQSLLEYHGIPIFQSFAGLKTNNGLTSTLATDGESKYDFTVQNDGADVTIITEVVTARIVKTLIEKDPLLSIFKLNKVLMPRELFTLAPTPAPAPSPEADAGSPKSSNAKHKSPPAPAGSSDSPANAPDGDMADQNSNDTGAVKFERGIFAALILSIWFTFLQF